MKVGELRVALAGVSNDEEVFVSLFGEKPGDVEDFAACDAGLLVAPSDRMSRGFHVEARRRDRED